MSDCLAGEKAIPDRVEKCHDWTAFTSLILSTGVRRFTKDNDAANKVVENWAEVVTAAFENGNYNYDKYVIAYKSILRPNGGRIIGIENYHPVSLLCDCLDEKTELAYVEHILNFSKGIYYVYDSTISALPQEFQSKNASRYLGAVELLVRYMRANYKLKFVADWLTDKRGKNGKWDMGKAVMLFALLKKDFLIVKKYVLIMAVAAALIPPFMRWRTQEFTGDFGFIRSVIFSVFMLLQYVSIKEYQFPKAATYLCAAPFSRKMMVLSKYVFCMVIYVLCCVIYGIETFVIPGSGALDIKPFALMFLAISAFIGLYLPVQHYSFSHVPAGTYEDGRSRFGFPLCDAAVPSL